MKEYSNVFERNSPYPKLQERFYLLLVQKVEFTPGRKYILIYFIQLTIFNYSSGKFYSITGIVIKKFKTTYFSFFHSSIITIIINNNISTGMMIAIWILVNFPLLVLLAWRGFCWIFDTFENAELGSVVTGCLVVFTSSLNMLVYDFSRLVLAFLSTEEEYLII